MIRKNKVRLIISSIIILLPMLLGVIGVGLLPERIAVHWGFDGMADGWMGASLIFFILPLVLLAVHWICMILTAVIDKNVEQNGKIFGLMFWIIPVISLVSCGMIFISALGYMPKMLALPLIIIGVAFIVIGNYMPKTVRNRTMGIKLKWTLANDENWSATHRFAGRLWVAIGFICLLAIPLPASVLPIMLILVILITVLLPTVYSYRFYKKQLADGKVTKEEYEAEYTSFFKSKKATVAITVVILAIVSIAVPVLMFTGKVVTTLGEDSLKVEASGWSDLTLKYEDIDAVEYRADGVDGVRVSGVGSAKLLLGNFKNDEFGMYTRYTYTKQAPCVVLTVEDKKIVIGTESEAQTKELYEKLLAEISE